MNDLKKAALRRATNSLAAAKAALALIAAELEVSNQEVEQIQTELAELCDRGLLTCTSGEPGKPDAAYAIA